MNAPEDKIKQQLSGNIKKLRLTKGNADMEVRLGENGPILYIPEFIYMGRKYYLEAQKSPVIPVYIQKGSCYCATTVYTYHIHQLYDKKLTR